jgi:hypothetical protein
MGRPMDGEFLRWYAHEREAAENSYLSDAARYKSTARMVWKSARASVYDGLTRAQAYVPERLGRLVLDTGTVGHPKFTLGLKRDRAVRYALSGAEWVVALSALALGCYAVTDDAVPLLAPADVGVDKELLDAWMECLASAPAQILLATTQEIGPVWPTAGFRRDPRWFRVDL